MRRCKGCERSPRFCGVLLDGYCADCRQLPLPFRAAAEAAARGEKPAELGACDDCDQGAHCRLPTGAKCLRHLQEGPAVELPPTMLELGWSCSKGGQIWLHQSGALVEFDGSRFGTRRTRRARLNGGLWEPISERFHVTIDRALADWTARHAQTPPGEGTLQRRRRRQGGAEATPERPQRGSTPPSPAPRARRALEKGTAPIGSGEKR